MTVLTGFTVISRKEVVNLGSTVTRKTKIPLYWSPLTGGVLMASGVVILLLGVREKPSS